MPDLQEYVPQDPESRLMTLEIRLNRLEAKLRLLVQVLGWTGGFLIAGWMLSEFVIWRMG